MPLQSMLERPVAYHRQFVDLGAGVTGALMLSQAVYWSSRTSDTDGWFYKTQAEWEAETGLTRREQETARAKLKALGLVEELKKGVPCKTYFRVNLEKVIDCLDVQKRQSSMAESAKLDCTKAPVCDGGKRQSITETTTEITSGSAQGAGAKVADIFEGSQYRPMTLGWKPDAATLKTYATMQGVQLEAFTDELIAGFVCHWAAHATVCDTAAGWCNRLVKWVKSEKVRAAVQPSAPEAGEADVPVDQIIDLYHRVCPNLPAVTVKADKALRSMIVERWNESPEHQSGKDFWLPFFQKANNRSQVFYRGQNVVPRLEALVSRAVFREISEAQQ
jgi:hypothetical protein